MADQVQNTKTPEGRVSFPKVFERSDFSGKYECTLVFPKGTDLTALKQIAAAAVFAKWGENRPAGLRNPFRKCGEKMEVYGETFDPDDIFVAFRSANRRPGLVDAAAQPIMEQGEFYPGCWARISTNAYTYTVKGNSGVAFGLINIQKIRDDDPLAGSSVKAEDEFAPLPGSANDPSAFEGGDASGLFDDEPTQQAPPVDGIDW